MIDEKQVRAVARLARLALTDAEVRLYQDQLGHILDSMNELGELDTRDVPPTSHVLGLTDVLRPDEARPFPHAQELIDAAPLKRGRYIRVPKVLE